MKAFLKEYLHLLLIVICEIIIGILLLVNPVGLSKTIIISVGIGLTGIGIYKSCRYLFSIPVKGKRSYALSIGVLLISAGILCIALNTSIENMLSGINMLFGSIMFVGCSIKLEMTVEMLRLKYGNVILMAIGTVFTLVFSILMILDVYSLTNMPMLLAGVSFLSEAVMDIAIIAFRSKKVHLPETDIEHKN